MIPPINAHIKTMIDTTLKLATLPRFVPSSRSNNPNNIPKFMKNANICVMGSKRNSSTIE
jgi:hypothetical protein